MKEPTCIYCGKAEEFSDEHVFPAGLGGDDQRFLLKGLVCKHCNTEVFSKLEAKVMRESIAALPRIFMQPHGRGKGKKASKPKLNTRINEIRCPDTGYMLEANLKAGGQPVFLPQVIMTKEQVAFTGPDQSGIKAFLDLLNTSLGNQIFTVIKQKYSSQMFEVTTLNWTGKNYSFLDKVQLAKPPKKVFWVEGMSNSSLENEARLFVRDGGQLVLRTKTPELAYAWLSWVKIHLSGMQEAKPQKLTKIDQPGMYISLVHNQDAYSRVLTKIGMNIAIHIYGEEFCRNSAFDPIKTSILSGNPVIRFLPDDNTLSEILSLIDHEHHAMILAPHKNNTSNYSLLFGIRLYGGPTHFIRLVDAHLPRPPIELPVFFSVDYESHKVERLELSDLVPKESF